MFGLGFTEIMFVGLLALILIGPEDLPKVARTIGRFYNDIKRSTDALKDEFNSTTRNIRNDLNVDLGLNEITPPHDPPQEPVVEQTVEQKTEETQKEPKDS